MKFTTIFALASATQAINLRQKFDYDTTGTYSPKPNMYTGFEGAGSGHTALTFTNASTGGFAGVNRVPLGSTGQSRRNVLNNGQGRCNGQTCW